MAPVENITKVVLNLKKGIASLATVLLEQSLLI